MKTLLLALHLLFAGIWLGCVLTEALFERALLGKGHEQERILGELHKKVDLFVEIPAFVLVLATGAMLLSTAPQSGLFQAKLGFAALALIANIYCVRLVFIRARYAAQGDWNAFVHVDHLQHKIGALVLIGILGAAGIGLYL